MRDRFFKALIVMSCFMGCLILSLMTMTPAFADPKFEAFIQTLWPQVKEAGIPRSLFDQAFAGITDPDPVVLKLAEVQPEFTSTTYAYLEKAVTPIRIDSGKRAAVDNEALLVKIENKYGVDRYVLLGIWGMESNFGKDKGSMSVMRSLATLIYAGRKKKYASEQLIAAFKILQKGYHPVVDFTGSWAAAMGHTQFIPSSYLSYAVDWTGDGKKDIWGSKEDALASTANYLAKSGWKADRPWGWEVILPANFNKALIGRTKWRSVAEWEKLGIKPAGKGKFRAPQARAFVMIPQGIDGPAFLVTDNFMAIMDYNLSHSYALAVGHLGDRIRGGDAFVGTWPEVKVDLTFEQRVELQKRLNQLGFETGGADGRFGARTYEAIIAYQKSVGLPMDGKPTPSLLARMQKQG